MSIEFTPRVKSLFIFPLLSSGKKTIPLRPELTNLQTFTPKCIMPYNKSMCECRVILERESDWPRPVKKMIFSILEAPSKELCLSQNLVPSATRECCRGHRRKWYHFPGRSLPLFWSGSYICAHCCHLSLCWDQASLSMDVRTGHVTRFGRRNANHVNLT